MISTLASNKTLIPLVKKFFYKAKDYLKECQSIYALWRHVYPALKKSETKKMHNFRFNNGLIFTNPKYLSKKVKAYKIDINQFYPSIFANERLPEGKMVEVTKDFYNYRKRNLSYPFEYQYCYFIDAIVTFDEVIIPYFTNTKRLTPNLCPLIDHRFYFNYDEINTLKKCYRNFKIIKINHIYRFRLGKSFFRKWIKEYYRIYEKTEMDEAKRKQYKMVANTFIGYLSCKKVKDKRNICYLPLTLYIWSLAKIKILHWVFDVIGFDNVVNVCTDAITFTDATKLDVLKNQYQNITKQLGDFKIEKENKTFLFVSDRIGGEVKEGGNYDR